MNMISIVSLVNREAGIGNRAHEPRPTTRARRQGLTLLELILALTMLAIILVASGSMNLFVLRAAILNAEEIRLQNELEYVLRDMEEHLTKNNYDPNNSENVTCAATGLCVVVTDPTGASTTRYEFVPGDSTGVLSRDGTILSKSLLPEPGPSRVFETFGANPLVPPGLIQVNLAAQTTTRHGKIITVGGTSRSYFPRGGRPITPTP